MSKDLNFRTLNADEIEVRIQSVNSQKKGAVLLLYKDARCDMNILDETVGAMNWQRSHSRDNANCVVSIYDEDKKLWVSKEDTGTESMTEKEKGLASDSFKRACFNWGIGRELYTAPFTWVKLEDSEIVNGKCYTRFRVKHIAYDDKHICELIIVDANNNERFFWSHYKRSTLPQSVDIREVVNKYLEENAEVKKVVLSYYKVDDLEMLSPVNVKEVYDKFKKDGKIK
ncbi:MAG: hypothetical protein MJZ98_00450 [Paludibacteraceae bacterium]|nr:hypothetical protein [Paludibacteraceae bacterium]